VFVGDIYLRLHVAHLNHPLLALPLHTQTFCAFSTA
jgi:hypothetical protein